GRWRRRLQKGVLLHRALFNGNRRLAALAVEDEQNSVGPHRREGLARPPAKRGVVEHQRRAEVMLPDVVMDDLEIPAHLSRFEFQRHDGIVEEVVAGPQLSAILRHRISGGKVYQSQISIDRWRRPNGTAAVLPNVAILRPGFVTRLARAGNDVEAPEKLSSLCIVGDGTTMEEVVTERHDANDNPVAISWSSGHALRGNLLRVCRGPDELPGFLADGHDVRIAEGSKKYPVADADAPPAAERRLGLEGPECSSGCWVECHDNACRRHDEHAPVFDDRRGLGAVRGFYNPCATQLFD